MKPEQASPFVGQAGGGFISSIQLMTERISNVEEYPFLLPALKALAVRLQLDSGATLFTGENGSGKSTLMEAIAVAAGFNAEGGSTNFRFSTRASESPLHRCIRLSRTHRRPQTGFFLRAESFFNVATSIEAMDREPAPAPPLINSYGGRSLHEQSHGESLMALVRHRFGPRGLYLLDEPEGGLSVKRQIELLQELNRHVTEKGSQLLVATHSPILLSLPDARIYHLGESGIRRIEYEETEAFRLSRDFILHRSG